MLHCVLHVNQATKDTSNFYPTWDLAEVTTLINLIALVCEATGLGMETSPQVKSNTNNAFSLNLTFVIECYRG